LWLAQDRVNNRYGNLIRSEEGNSFRFVHEIGITYQANMNSSKFVHTQKKPLVIKRLSRDLN